MRALFLILVVFALLGAKGCEKISMVVIKNPATGTLEKPYRLVPGERLSLLLSTYADPASVRVRIFPAMEGDDACPFYGGPEITGQFEPKPFGSGATITAIPPGRLSVCGPFKLRAEANAGRPLPEGKEAVQSAEIWFEGFEVEELPPDQRLEIGRGESRDVRLIFGQKAIAPLTVTATLSGDDVPVALVNGQRSKAEVQVAGGAREAVFTVNGANRGECFIWFYLPGGPAIAKTIKVK
jgi:hypothetical protein